MSRRDGSLRVATLSLWGRGPHRRRRLDAMIAALAELAPDVVCLQELWEGAAEEVAEALGMGTWTGVAALAPPHLWGEPDTAVLTEMDTRNHGTLELPGHDEADTFRTAAWAGLETVTGRRWTFTSAHLPWGATREMLRLRHARILEDLAHGHRKEEPSLVQVLCGNLNATPESATLRYLTGLEPFRPDESSTLWLDAHAAVGAGPGHTFEPAWAGLVMAGLHGIDDPTLVPGQRTDYVLVRGYRHGRPGCPLSCRLLPTGWIETPRGPLPTSNRHGLVVDLWDPAPITPDPSQARAEERPSDAGNHETGFQ